MLSNSILISIALGLLELFAAFFWHKSAEQRDKKWYKLFLIEFGPRTDVDDMSRKEIYRSGRIFMVWTFHAVFLLSVIIAILVHYYDTPEDIPVILIAIAMAIFPLIVLIFFVSGLYLFIRGFFRSKSYDMWLTGETDKLFGDYDGSDDVDEVEIGGDI